MLLGFMDWLMANKYLSQEKWTNTSGGLCYVQIYFWKDENLFSIVIGYFLSWVTNFSLLTDQDLLGF